MNTQESNVKTVRDLTEQVFNQHDAGRIKEYYSQGAKWHGGALGTVEGGENMINLFRSVFSGIPDLRAVEQEVVAQGDTVVVRLVVEGTHKGNLLGIPATGKHLRWDAVDLYKLSGGKVSEVWAGDDFLAVMIETGAFKPPWMGN
jgi:predicted ester cyclase